MPKRRRRPWRVKIIRFNPDDRWFTTSQATQSGALKYARSYADAGWEAWLWNVDWNDTTPEQITRESA